jgi:PKHD-type hydroxylase
MFLTIEKLLDPGEVQRLQEIAARIRFVDGKATNPHTTVKHNLQADQSTSDSSEASSIVFQAFRRSRDFEDFALPQMIAPPLLTKYGPGQHYGEHIDAGEIIVGNQRIRTDLSCTVFLNDPDSYEGGELESRLGNRTMMYKGQPGDAIVYPSTTYHQVKEVTKGERLVAITFIQSRLPDSLLREILYELGEVYAYEADNMKWENRNRLEFVQQNLKRLWLR